MWIMVRDFELKIIRRTGPIACIRSNGHLKGSQVVGVGEKNFGDLAAIEFSNVCWRKNDCMEGSGLS